MSIAKRIVIRTKDGRVIESRVFEGPYAERSLSEAISNLTTKGFRNENYVTLESNVGLTYINPLYIESILVKEIPESSLR